MTPDQQLEKLAKALAGSGIAANKSEAVKKAREMLRIPQEKPKPEQTDPRKLPSVEDLEEVPFDLDIDTDKTLKELLNEEGKEIYRKKAGKK